MPRPVALVTGSASGIGRACAVALARAGFDVAIDYSRSEQAVRQTEAEVKSAGGNPLVIKADVSREDEIVAMIAAVEQTFGGRLDVLVNNAGITADTPPAQFDTMSARNSTGCSR